MFFLILFILELVKDFYNYTIFKKMKIFKIIKNYYLIKYKYFILWKNTVYFFIVFNFIYKKYYIISILNLFLISIGYALFFENVYDFYFSKNINLSDPIFKDLEPSFNITNPELTDKVPSEMTHSKIQKSEIFYGVLFLTLLSYLIIIISSDK